MKCPAGNKKPDDICSDERWGENYLHLVWTLQVIKEFFLGSVSDRVADGAKCPVLIVK